MLRNKNNFKTQIVGRPTAAACDVIAEGQVNTNEVRGRGIKSDYGLQFINNIFLLKSSLHTGRGCHIEQEREREDESNENVK